MSMHTYWMIFIFVAIWLAMPVSSNADSTTGHTAFRRTVPDYVLNHRADWRNRVPPDRTPPPISEWFPMGVYAGLEGEDTLEFMLDDLKQHNCNTLYLNGGGAHIGRLLDLAEKADIRVYLQDQDSEGAFYFRPHRKNGQQLQAELQRATAAAERIMPAYRDRWGLLCWGLTEEIKPEHVPYVARYLQAVRPLDPTHPAIILHNNLKSAAEEYKLASPSVVISDTYPFHYAWAGSGPTTERGAIAFLQRQLKSYGQLAEKYDAPLWWMGQSFSQWSTWEETGIRYRGGYPMTTPAQIKVQSWLALANGAKGLFYFFYHYRDDSQFIALRTATWRETVNWKIIGELFAKIKPHTPLLLKLKKTNKTIATASDSAITLGAFTYDDRYYLIVANTDLAKTVSFTLSLEKNLKSRGLYNLHTGKPTGASLHLLPGDGAVLLVGNANAWKKHQQQFPVEQDRS